MTASQWIRTILEILAALIFIALVSYNDKNIRAWLHRLKEWALKTYEPDDYNVDELIYRPSMHTKTGVYGRGDKN